MKRFLTLALLLLLVSGFAACSAEDYGPQTGIPNDEGSSLLIEATRAAQRVISERKTATIQAVTMVAQNTEQANARNATGTVQAIWAYQQERDGEATAQALSIQSAQTRQAATDTAIAHSSQATGTADAQEIEIAGTRTSASVQATATTYAATSTRSAQELQAALEGHQATATAEALEMRRTLAQEDAARARSWSEFFDALVKGIVGIGSIAFLLMLLVQVGRYLDVLAMRQRVLETRAGTIMVIATNGQYDARLIKPTPNLLDEGDDFEPSEAHEVPAQELLKLTNARGETFITKTDPQAEMLEQHRKLAMRLLRESMRYYTAQGFDVQRINRVPSFRNLEWSSETWVRAVSAMKPYVITKQGRGGGTMLGEQFPTLPQLYTAIGERRITLSADAQPSPTLEPVPA